VTLLIAVHFLVACAAPLLTRLLRHRAFFVLALAPAAAFLWCVSKAPIVLAGGTVDESVSWIPTLGIDLSVRMGMLQWVLALIVSGIGALVLVYCRWYFASADPPVRTAGVLTAFAGAMLGLVTANDLIALYIYWELTTVFSYLLVGHNPARSANRRAALTALMVTTFGGLAMLVGIVMLGHLAGTYQISTILADPAVTGSRAPIVVVAVLLLLVGAVSKSALIPFHFWLPGAMAAPTPVSAYLHAAAMVKAGVYLVALLSPAFADLPGWRPVIMLLGSATMILGGWRALRQLDIKLLLAYGTVSQLGFMIIMCGLGTRAAQLAGIALIISHALFKSALFLVVGVVDTRTGTRDLRRLSGVGRAMPWVAGAAMVAGASMAGVPPTLGFISKEAAFEALTYLVAGDVTQVPPVPALLLTAAVVAGSALTVAYTLRFLWGAFGTKEAIAATPVSRVGPIAGVPILLAACTLIGGFAGHALTDALRPAVDLVTVGHESHGIALWHGLSVPLAMSAFALGSGAAMFLGRRFVAKVQSSLPHVADAEEVYQQLMRGLDRLAVEVTARTQRGSLPIYLGVILVVLVVLPGGVLLFVTDWPMAPIVADNIGQVVVAIIMIAAAFLAASSRGRLKAVILVGVTGYGTVLLFVLHGAPDLALTQVLVETVTLVAFVLVLRKLPKYFTNRPLQVTRWWRLVIAILVGVTVSGIVLLSSGSRIAEPVSKAYYQAAYEFGYGKNIVNVTLVDIRAWDTMGEISVLVVAATGVASLIFIRRRYVGERPMRVEQVRREGRSAVKHPQALATRSTWLRGTEALSPLRRSIVFEVVTRLLFPVMIMCSLYFLYVGHNAPGGGFAAGLVAGLALIIRYLAGGSHELDEAAPVDAGRVLGIGLLVAAGGILWPVLIGGRIGQSYDAAIRLPWLQDVVLPWGAPLFGEFHLVTSLFFDIGVYLVVIGVMLDIARSLGSGIDQHESDNRTPGPVTAGPRASAAATAAAATGARSGSGVSGGPTLEPDPSGGAR
jgi:multicomponent Na+:H+ antiporter subunit A